MIKNLLKNKFAKSVMTIVSGTAFAQGLNIILSPVVTRLFSPEEYGILVTYTAIIGMLSLGAFKYELALPIERDDKKAINILTLSILLLSVFVIIITFCIVFFDDYFLKIFNSEVLSNYILLIPIGVLFGGLYTILNKWAYRNRDYKTISKTIMNQSLFSNLIKIIAGLVNLGSLGLIVGQIIGISSGIRVLSKPIYKNIKNFLGMINKKEIMWSLKRYRDFPIYNMPSSFLLSLGSSLPTLYYTATFGSTVAGHYGLAYTIAKFPMNLLGNSIADVFFAEAANIGKQNPMKLNVMLNKLLKKLFFIGLIPLFILLTMGPELFSLVFGREWYISGQYSQIISIMIFFMFLFEPSGKIFIIFEKQRLRLLLDIIRIILVILVFGIANLYNLDAYLTIFLYSFVMSLNFLTMYFVSKNILKSEIRKLNHLGKKKYFEYM